MKATKKKATMLSYFTQDSDAVASSACSSLMQAIVAGSDSTTVKRKMSDTHYELIKPRSDPGQPPLVDSQPALLETIINIAIHGSAADERRRTEMIRSCLPLSELHENL
ncbi:hypothetical protein EVAR_7297_1 [Eumeta japonica]|uniref:Uncharacterized protein n=1 Tax=Eumeta variegata TaxID=151549 RepID=A0A4C1T2L2_EUMVA|nr:hypothetical protein EVAR_7297_1 [Eumeta japonica]